jgi:hypothetical protein
MNAAYQTGVEKPYDVRNAIEVVDVWLAARQVRQGEPPDTDWRFTVDEFAEMLLTEYKARAGRSTKSRWAFFRIAHWLHDFEGPVVERLLVIRKAQQASDSEG